MKMNRLFVRQSIKQRGLTLVELLVSIALGLFLTWGAVQAFLSGKQGYSMQQALSRIQENGRMAQELMGYDIRDSGNYGCAVGKFVSNGSSVTDPANTLTNAANVEFAFANAVFAVNDVSGAANGDMALLTNLNPAPVAGTDILVVHTSTHLGSEVLAVPVPTAAMIGVQNRGLQSTDILALSDCTRNFIFKPTSVTGSATQTITAAFGTPPIPGSTVMRLDTVIYYIANNPTTGIPALYRRLLNGNSEELLSGVENMQLQIGIDTNNNGVVDIFRTPDLVTAAQWSAWNDDPTAAGLLDSSEQNVVAVRYSLLLRSEENLLDQPQTYTYNGAAVTAAAGDLRLRQIVTNTIGIRSRVN